MMKLNSQDPPSESKLNASQEMLLMSYLDGEAGIFRRWRAERLLKKSIDARRFTETCKQTTRVVQDLSPDRGEVNLWDKIDARIDQEERNALFLGERKFNSRVPIIEAFRDYMKNGAVLGGVSGGAVATAALIFFWTAPQGVQPVDAPAVGAQNVAGSLNTRINQPPSVNFVSSGGAPTMNSIRRRVPVEVEWMRSDGMVRMIPDNRTGVPIIWVKRQPPMMIKRNSSSRRRSIEPRYSSEGLAGAETTPIPTTSLQRR